MPEPIRADCCGFFFFCRYAQICRVRCVLSFKGYSIDVKTKNPDIFYPSSLSLNGRLLLVSQKGNYWGQSWGGPGLQRSVARRWRVSSSGRTTSQHMTNNTYHRKGNSAHYTIPLLAIYKREASSDATRNMASSKTQSEKEFLHTVITTALSNHRLSNNAQKPHEKCYFVQEEAQLMDRQKYDQSTSTKHEHKTGI